MMKFKRLSNPEKWILIGIPVQFLIGAIIHFGYDFFGENPAAGLFFPINESVWEHSKMVVLPVILWWSLYYLLKARQYSINKNKWFAGALISLATALTAVPMLYYFYTQAFGVEIMWVDIAILLVALFLGQVLGLHLFRHSMGYNAYAVISVFITIFFLFILFTFFPPNIPIFIDISK